MAQSTDFSAEQLAEVSALADGSLDPARRAAAQSRIAASPELQALYERERRVVSVLDEARARDRAPASLRAALAAARQPKRVRVRRRVALGGLVSAALAGVLLALVLVLPGGAPGAPSVSEAAALALRGPVAPAPAPDPSAPALKLTGGFGEAYFPNWARRFGWRAVGTRRDRLGGRLAVTVYYAWRHGRIAYTIVDRPALATPRAPTVWMGGTAYETLTVRGRTVVTWRRAGHTCVLSGPSAPASALRRLAAWAPAS